LDFFSPRERILPFLSRNSGISLARFLVPLWAAIMLTTTIERPTLESLQEKIQRMEARLYELLDMPRLCCKEVMARYGITRSTFYRWRDDKKLPAPVVLGGPRWKLSDLEAAEKAGQLPVPG
jgi:predicted DNA-binding transcriptional regulator AlpA